MRKLILLVATAGLLPLTGAAAQAVKAVQAPVVRSDGRVMGQVRLSEGPTGVLVVVTARGLKPGWHGAHFHEAGDCSNGFKKAGGHILRGSSGGHADGHGATAHGAGHPEYGLLNEKTNDAGALPNIYVGRDGTGAAEIYTTFVSLRGRGGRPALLDRNGSSLIIHEGPEDQNGIAATVGNRAACAAIK